MLLRSLGNGDDEGVDGTLEHVRVKAEQMDDDLNQLQSWKTKMDKNFELLEKGEERSWAEHRGGKEDP